LTQLSALLISAIGLKPGGWLQRLAEREFHASK
jgi:hypothetical protein